MSNKKNIIDEKKIKENLNTAYLGKTLKVFDSIPSTNSYAKSIALKQGCDNMVIIANEQTSGRGRLARKFISSPDGVYLSFIIKPDRDCFNVGLLTVAVALSVKRAVESVAGIKVKIKWPNDILYGNKKLCGILSESVIDGADGTVKYIVCGIGINCNNTSFPEEICDIATSLRLASENETDKTEFIISLLNELDGILYKTPYYLNKNSILNEYKKSLAYLGSPVRVIYPKTEVKAVPIDIDSNGGLIIKLDSGEIKTIYSGEVSLREGL